MNERKTTVAGRNAIVRQFDSLAEFLDLQPTREYNKNLLKEIFWEYDSRSSQGLRDWYGEGVKGSAHGLELLKNGNPDLVQRIERELDAMRDIQLPQSMKRKIKRGDHGDEYDIHRAYRGDFGRAWTRRAKQSANHVRQVKIVCQLATKWSRKEAQLFWKGAAVAKLCALLNDAGYQVEIVGALHMEEAWRKFDALEVVPIKEAEQQLDAPRVAAALAAPAMFRAAGFKAFASHPDYDCHSLFGFDYGRFDKKAAGEALVSTERYLFASNDIESKQTAEDWIEQSLKEIQSLEGDELEAA